MITLYSYPTLFGVADNNGYGLKVFAFLRLVSAMHDLLGKPASTFPDHAAGRLHLRVAISIEFNRVGGLRADRAVRYFVHDPLDGVGAPAAPRRESEAAIHLAHPRPSSGIRNRGPNLMVTKRVARADDHRPCPN
jgi:hypothetical protein